MLVKFKKLREDAIDPIRANENDAGVDLTAVDVKKAYRKKFIPHPVIPYEEDVLSYIEYDTGIAVAIPKNYVGLLFPRSSVSNYDLDLANSVGVIDSGYRGSIKFRYKITDINPVSYKVGDKVGQLVIVPIPTIVYEEVDELDETERGTGGFGSSGE